MNHRELLYPPATSKRRLPAVTGSRPVEPASIARQRRKGYDVFQDNRSRDDWCRLISEVISSWRTVLRAAVLVLASTPFAVVLVALVIVFR